MTRLEALERLEAAVRRTPALAQFVRHELNILDRTLPNVVSLDAERRKRAKVKPRTAA